MKQILKYTFRILLIIIGSLFSLLIISLLLLQTPFAKSKIVDFAQDKANEILNATLTIDKLEGNFFTHIELKKVLLIADNDTIAHIEEINVSYNLVALLNSTIDITEVKLEKPYVYLQQLKDSTWNLQHLVKPTDKKDTTSSSFDMTVDLGDFVLNKGRVRINAFDTILPKLIDDLNIKLTGSYSNERQSVDIKSLGFYTSTPDFTVQNLKTSIKADNKQIRLLKLLLKTGNNEITVEGNYFFDHKNNSVFHLHTAPVKLEEFAFFLPSDFKLKIHPVLNIDGSLLDAALKVKIYVQNEDQFVRLDLVSQHLVNYFMDPTRVIIPTYKIVADIHKVDLRDWLNDKAMYYILNGKFKAKGEGFDPKTLNARMYGALNKIVANGIEVKEVNLDMYYNAGDIKGKMDANGTFGSVKVYPVLYGILSNRPSYNVKLTTNRLNVQPFVGKNFTSDLNMYATIKGAGFNPKTLNAKSLIIANPSRIMTFMLDTIHSEIDYSTQNILIKSLFLKTLNSSITAVGNYSLVGASDLNLTVNIDNAKEIADLMKMDSLNTQVKMQVHLSGVPTNLDAKINLEANNSVYKAMTLSSLIIDGNVNLKKDKICINTDIFAGKFNTGGFMIDSLKMKAKGNTKNLDINLNVNNSDIITSLTTNIKMSEKIDIALSKFALKYKEYDWNQNLDTAHFIIDGKNYTVKNFSMVSPGVDTLQSITANGIISLQNKEDFQLNISNIYLPELAKVFNLEQKLEGLFSANMNLNGTAQNPVLESQFQLKNGMVQDFRFSNFEGDIHYNNKQLATNVNIVAFDSGFAKLEAKIPALFRLDSMKFSVIENSNSPLQANVKVQKLPLSLINAFLPTDEASGFVQSDITVDGTMKQPNINGHIGLLDGKLKIKKYGVDYRSMNAAVNFDDRIVKIDTFHIQSRKGDMYAEGEVDFGTSLYKGKMNAAGMRIKFDEFNPFDHNQYNMELSGNINLKADKDSTRFSGDLTIPEAMVFIPAILNLMGKTIVPELPTPLLAAQLQKDSLSRDSVVFNVKSDSTKKSSESLLPAFSFVDNLQGKINLKIPRNVWIKNKEMRIELGGDIQLIKHRDYFELFGPINVLRGQYSLLGKVFVIKSGVITFEGGEDMDARLDVEAQYSFRDAQREKHDLLLVVGGYISAPEISFKFEDKQISEGDALSYILFGADLESLGSEQRENMNSSGMDASDIAKTAVASLLSSQLTKLLGNTLNMDFIEFKSSGSFDNASFVVGKYITDKIFVSYEQNIGKIENPDEARYEMRMEYELFKFLFFQLTSSSLSNGFDLIFKFDEKPKEK